MQSAQCLIMATELQASQKSLYETDFVCWVETIAQQLRSQDYANVDWVNLIEEIENLSRRERRSLESNLIVLLLHLLKWQHQVKQRSGSWKSSIREHRRRINKDLKDSLSLNLFYKKSSLNATRMLVYKPQTRQA